MILAFLKKARKFSLHLIEQYKALFDCSRKTAVLIHLAVALQLFVIYEEAGVVTAVCLTTLGAVPYIQSKLNKALSEELIRLRSEALVTSHLIEGLRTELDLVKRNIGVN